MRPAAKGGSGSDDEYVKYGRIPMRGDVNPNEGG